MPEIPIQNVYYLLCYAWGHMREGEIVEAGATGRTKLANLFAQVLVNGTRRVLRQGLDRGYVTRSEDMSRLRGRVELSTSIQRALLPRAQAHCRYGTLSQDVIHNRILKSTMRHLARTEELDGDLRDGLTRLVRRFRNVRDVPLRRSLFRRVQLHSNNAFYRFLMNVCALVEQNLVVEEGGEGRRFRDFRKDDAQMGALFERFVRRFYEHEQNRYRVSAPHIRWDLDSPAPSHLPSMQTDVVLQSNGRTIIIDTKYYARTLQSHHGTQSYHSANLYQLFAYLKNAEAKSSAFEEAEGLLLYPTVAISLDEAFRVQGHEVRLRTLNLAQDWVGISNDLLAFAGCR